MKRFKILARQYQNVGLFYFISRIFIANNVIISKVFLRMLNMYKVHTSWDTRK